MILLNLSFSYILRQVFYLFYCLEGEKQKTKKQGVSQQDRRGQRPPGLSLKTTRDGVIVSKPGAGVSCHGPVSDSLWERLKHPSIRFAKAALGQRQSPLPMLSSSGYAGIRDRDIPEDTIPLQVVVNLSDITQNSPMSCSEALSVVQTGWPERAGTLQRNLPWFSGKDL